MAKLYSFSLQHKFRKFFLNLFRNYKKLIIEFYSIYMINRKKIK